MQSVGGVPFPSPLLDMQCFSNETIWGDTLHLAYRGFAPNFVASALLDIFGKQGLDSAYDLAKLWASARKLHLSLDSFTLSDEAYPSLNAKGWDIKLLCCWLVTCLHVSTFDRHIRWCEQYMSFGTYSAVSVCE